MYTPVSVQPDTDELVIDDAFRTDHGIRFHPQNRRVNGQIVHATRVGDATVSVTVQLDREVFGENSPFAERQRLKPLPADDEDTGTGTVPRGALLRVRVFRVDDEADPNQPFRLVRLKTVAQDPQNGWIESITSPGVTGIAYNGVEQGSDRMVFTIRFRPANVPEGIHDIILSVRRQNRDSVRTVRIKSGHFTIFR